MRLFAPWILSSLCWVISADLIAAEDVRPDEPAATQPAAAAAPEATPPTAAAAPAASAAGWLWDRTSIGALWYLGYSFGETEGQLVNAFDVGRGYTTLKFKPADWLQSRVTIDTSQDDAGDWKMRLKYLYGKFAFPLDTALVTAPELEVGVVHGPWLDFEEHVNRYRMEGEMFLERSHLLNSADLGATLSVLLGPKLPEAYRHEVSGSYPGTWGSLQLGVYNGGGYHAIELNPEKVFASRLSLRPAGPWLPNLQLSHFFLAGNGNTTQSPGWMINNFMASFEHASFTLAAQVGLGQGDQKGSRVGVDGRPVDWTGASVFAEGKLPALRSSALARLDYFDWEGDGGEPPETRLIAGYAFHFLPGNFALLSLEHLSQIGAGPAEWRAKATLQLAYPLE